MPRKYFGGPTRVRPWKPRVYYAPAIGGAAPAPVLIPYSWLSTPDGQPIQWRPDKPITSYEITQTAGGVATGYDAASQAEYGDNTYTATLDTANPQDATNLGTFTLAFYATQAGSVPRQRFSVLQFVLNARTLDEQVVIMSVLRGQRISIRGAPATWAQGMTEQVVEGIGDSIAPSRRIRAWLTSPVVASTPISAGQTVPWFHLGASAWGGTDVRPW